MASSLLRLAGRALRSSIQQQRSLQARRHLSDAAGRAPKTLNKPVQEHAGPGLDPAEVAELRESLADLKKTIIEAQKRKREIFEQIVDVLELK